MSISAAPVRQLVARLVAALPHGRARLAAAVALSVAASGASVGLMATSAWLLSRAAEQPPILYLMVAVTGVRAFGLSRGVLRYAERLVGHDLALRIQSALRLQVYAALSRTTLLGRRRGDLLVRIVDDVRAVLDAVVRVLVPFAAAGVVAAATTALVALALPGAGLALGLSALVAGVVVPGLARVASARADASVAPLRGDLGQAVAALHRSAPDLVAYGLVGRTTDRIDTLTDRLAAAEDRAARVRGLAGALHVLTAGAAVIAGLAVGAPAVADGRLPGVMLAVLVLTPLALHEVLEPLSEAAQVWTRVGSALHRVAEVLASPPDARDVTPHRLSGPPSIELRDLTTGHAAAAPVVVGLDLRVRAGERVALVGPSGSGKSTLAATLIGLLAPTAGEVEVHGALGYLAQDAHVFDTTVEENVRIGRRDATRADVQDALRRAGLDLDPERAVGEHGVRLSGGEARRLAVARLFVGGADVLVLDEPTEHLDEQTARELVADLWAATVGAAVLVITHDPEVRAACDREVDIRAYAPVARSGP